MGEVYRASDPRLGRDVALKVLHGDVSQSPERRSRFEREARSVAALNHPNIVSMFDIGEEDGMVFFVSELVDGELLRARIERGPMAIRELLDIAIQLADGISAAHAVGISHRDLKPENVMINRDGRVKILDFGLARQAHQTVMPAESTATMHYGSATQPGSVMGTAEYMSPEQVRGGATDHRTDQFSLGIVLYEMLTGKQPFHRETAVQTMSAVITDDPAGVDPDIQAKLPPPLRWTIERCLAKDPQRRYESSRDLYEDLRYQREHLTDASTKSFFTALPVKKPSRSAAVIWELFSLGLLLALASVTFVWLRSRETSSMLADYRFTPFAFSAETQGFPAWSPDGKAAAYVGGMNGQDEILVRYRTARVPVQLTTMGVQRIVRWSPDSRRIFFVAMNKMADPPVRALWSIAAVGGDPELLMTLDTDIAEVSPDGQTLAVYKADADGARRVYISQPIGKSLHPYPSGKFANKSRIGSPIMRFSPDGRNILLLFNDGEEKRWLLPFPADRGEPREVLANLRESPFTPSFDWFPDSRHIAVGLPVVSGGPINLWQADVFGSGVYPLTASPSSQFQPAVSPGGKAILFTEGSSDYDLAYVTLADGKTEKVLSTARDEFHPAWAHESLSYAYVTNVNGAPEIWLHGEDGAARPVVTSEAFAPERIDFFMNPSPFPKADRVIYTAKGSSSGIAYLWISSATGGAPARVTNSTDAYEYAGALSPDGKQAVYLAAKGSRASLMRVKTSGQSTPVLVREDVDPVLPSWSPDGNWITAKINRKWNLVSSDGMQLRSLGDLDADHLAFSTDGSRLYSIHKDGGKDRQVLVYIPAAGGKETLVGEIAKDFRPVSPLNPGFRLSVCPDGATALFTVGKYRANIWLFEGFKPPT